MSTTDGNPESCVVCFKSVEYYSVGECDHPVCYECSTRMRVLCIQNECPICRQQLARVVFTAAVEPYKQLRSQVFTDKLFERQYKIGFSTEEIKDAYERVLEHRCRLCETQPPFRTFSLLSDHLRKVHERHFCDLCVKHLKIFTSERRCYTRQELARHRRKGDIDDTSHRGHPLCEFCEERYMDTDELYRHLRKEHLYCHLCDADGRNLYYGSHKDLAQHFRTDHYLCEEGECATQHLTAVFRSEIDLIAHKASVHGRGLARAAARQARTLELQFNITPHAAFANRQPRSEGNLAGGGGGRDGGGVREGSGGGGRDSSVEMASASMPGPPPQSIDTGSVQQFPRLSSAPAASSLLAAPSRHYQGSSTLVKTKENFPALDGGAIRPPPPPPVAPRGPPAAAMLRTNSKPGLSVQLHGQPASASSFRLTGAGGHRISAAPQQNKAKAIDRERLYEDFPSLSTPNDDHPSIGASAPQPPKVTLVSSEQMQAMKSNNSSQGLRKPQLNLEEAFPALSARSAPSAPASWVTAPKPKEKVKPSKAAPAPKLNAPAFNPVADFPHLTITNKKSKNKKPNTEPPATAAPKPASEENTKLMSKKEKKKLTNNNKVLTLQDINQPNGVLETSKTNTVAATAWDGKKMGNETKSKTDNNVGSGCELSSNGNEKLTNGELPFQLADEYYPPLSMSNGPPGFRCRPSCDGLTFTNSAGQTYSAPLHSYIPPPEFNQRNVQLVQKFADALGPAMQDFRDVSRAFRNSDVSADDFYAHCKAAMGSRLKDLFPELVALLPDIAKQQELVVGREAGLDMCAACGQLLALADRPAHAAVHWPALGPR